MTEPTPFRDILRRSMPAPVQLPSGFQPVTELLHPWIDRKLGYFGDARYVLFYYEPRGDEVMWKDGRSYGFGLGGWCYFAEHVAPVAAAYGFDLGSSDAAGPHVLLIDRLRREAYFTDREAAEQFIEERQGFMADP